MELAQLLSSLASRQWLLTRLFSFCRCFMSKNGMRVNVRVGCGGWGRCEGGGERGAIISVGIEK